MRVRLGTPRKPLDIFCGGWTRERGPHRHRRRGAHADGRLSRRLEGRVRPCARRARHFGRGRAGGDRGRQRRRNPDGLRAAGRAGPGAGASGRDRRRIAARGWRDHDQQDVRLGHEGGHGRPRPLARRLGRCRRRRRHGEHEQRALSARPRALRLPHGPRPHYRPHVPRRPRGRLRQGAPDGDVRRGLRGRLSVHPPGAGRLRARLARARQPRDSRTAISPGRSRRSA